MYFDDERIVIVDNGLGMFYEDLMDKWFFVVYLLKCDDWLVDDFCNIVVGCCYYVGSKGIGRFLFDCFGEEVMI